MVGCTDPKAANFQATANQDNGTCSYLAVTLRHASHACPDSYGISAWIGGIHAGADGYDFTNGPQNWALCSKSYQGQSLALLRHSTHDCPAGFGRVAWLGGLHAGADGYDFTNGPQNWALCAHEYDGGPVVQLKHASHSCDPGFSRIAFLGGIHASADGYDFSNGPQNWALCAR